MENLKTFYEDYAVSFEEYISKIKRNLKKDNLAYCNLLQKIEDEKDMFPNVRDVLENARKIELNKIEIQSLIRIRDIKLKMQSIENQAMFFAGGKEAYLYFKKLDIIK